MAKDTKKVEKFAVKCLANFRDKYTNKIHKKGEIFKVTEERYTEIRKVGNLVEKYTEPAKDNK